MCGQLHSASAVGCITDDLEKLNENIYRKITTVAEDPGINR